jgi:hypothetical protein
VQRGKSGTRHDYDRGSSPKVDGLSRDWCPVSKVCSEARWNASCTLRPFHANELESKSFSLFPDGYEGVSIASAQIQIIGQCVSCNHGRTLSCSQSRAPPHPLSVVAPRALPTRFVPLPQCMWGRLLMSKLADLVKRLQDSSNVGHVGKTVDSGCLAWTRPTI